MFLLPFQQKSGIFRKRKTIQRGRRSERRKRKREIEKWRKATEQNDVVFEYDGHTPDLPILLCVAKKHVTTIMCIHNG